jgi:GGDEF domain-containing protein
MTSMRRFALKGERATATREVAQYVQDLARQALYQAAAPGYDRDGLTGLQTRALLWANIRKALFGSSWTDTSRYRERFLCVDLHRFKDYVGRHGFAPGDTVLQAVPADIRDHFGETTTYRVGGDEFVVVLGDRPAWLPAAPLEITLKYGVVEVDLQRDHHRHSELADWIEMHLTMAVLAAATEGILVKCSDPMWVKR